MDVWDQEPYNTFNKGLDFVLVIPNGIKSHYFYAFFRILIIFEFILSLLADNTDRLIEFLHAKNYKRKE